MNFVFKATSKYKEICLLLKIYGCVYPKCYLMPPVICGTTEITELKRVMRFACKNVAIISAYKFHSKTSMIVNKYVTVFFDWILWRSLAKKTAQHKHRQLLTFRINLLWLNIRSNHLNPVIFSWRRVKFVRLVINHMRVLFFWWAERGVSFSWNNEQPTFFDEFLLLWHQKWVYDRRGK